MSAAMEIETLTRQQAARSAQVGLSTLDRAIQRGELRVKRAGRRVVILRSEFVRWLQGDSQVDAGNREGGE